MKVKLLGFQPVDFVNNAGSEISGVNIFVGFAEEGVDGVRTEKFFINNNSSIVFPNNAKIGCVLELSFNYKGKLIEISPAQ